MNNNPNYVVGIKRENIEKSNAIVELLVHENKDIFLIKLSEGQWLKRTDIIDDITSSFAITYKTAYKSDKGDWIEGAEIIPKSINDKIYLKTVDNGKEEDNLGNLPEY